MAADPPDQAELTRLRAELDEERRRNAALQAALAQQEKAPRRTRTEGPRNHRFWIALLLVLGTVLTPIAMLAIFLKTQITDTGRYVQTVKPLASDPAVQAYVAEELSHELFAHVDIGKYVREALPRKARPLSGPLTNGIKSFTNQAIARVLQTKQFETAWVEANKLTHAQLVKVLTGQGDGFVSTRNGAVTVDLSGVAATVKQNLEDSGLSVFDSVPTSAIGGKITIFRSEDLHRAQQATSVLQTLSYVLPFLVAGCFIGAIVLSTNRRRAFVQTALCFALGALVLAALLAIGRVAYLDAATGSGLPRDAAADVYDTLLRYLHTAIRAAVSFSVVIIVADFFAGSSRLAVWSRDGVRRTVHWLGAESDRAGWEFLAPLDFVVRYKARLRVVVAVVGFLILFRWRQPTPVVVFSLAIVALVFLALIEFFGREPVVGEPIVEPPAAEPPELEQPVVENPDYTPVSAVSRPDPTASPSSA
jgi:hypothetical protein